MVLLLVLLWNWVLNWWLLLCLHLGCCLLVFGCCYFVLFVFAAPSCWWCCYLCFVGCCYYDLPGCYLKPYLYLVDGPRGVIAPSQNLSKVLTFPLKKLWVSANCFFSVGKCTNDTILCRETMMTVPFQVLICMCQLAVHCNG